MSIKLNFCWSVFPEFLWSFFTWSSQEHRQGPDLCSPGRWCCRHQSTNVCAEEACMNHFSPKFYSMEPTLENCREACETREECVCSKCKCCTSCSNKCNCSFTNTGADASLARQLLPSISPEYLEEQKPSFVFQNFICLSILHPGRWRPPRTLGLC